MCAPIWTIWMSRNNNRPIEERTDVVRGSAINTRVVKLAPLSKDKVAVSGNPKRTESPNADPELRNEENESPK
ncbi:hypothetical protein NA56DRAFT_323155 [Hyaloscypha hepaticicola]|uniref:Uncharacterized protein n=1 Tax=Hyaloscypha hepaticicola TaxID=2082293 RepID=A0A2J6PQI7_9HELO|nr:hypothetical protein NA56DRAFT_323155 [Hyaloscypha hepaticicola]